MYCADTVGPAVVAAVVDAVHDVPLTAADGAAFSTFDVCCPTLLVHVALMLLSVQATADA